MKSLLVNLWLRLLRDCARVGSYPGTTRDKMTILSRVESEGESFLTITLPSFGRDFERSLDLGYVDPALFRQFRKSGAIPAFLQGMLGRVFDGYGKLRQEPDIKAIEHIRQLAFVFKKLEAKCSEYRNRKALDAYRTVERDLSVLKVDQEKLNRFSLISRLLWCNFELPTVDELRPRFGPGVTADKLSHSARREHPVWHSRLDRFFPFYGTALSIGSYDGKDVDLVSEEHESPVRVILVPKTLKGPRVIAAEPACMQYCQQSLLDHLDRQLEKRYRSSMSLRDQGRNQQLSRSLAYATLDLSEASDRCHGALVWLMLESCPLLRDASFACRSTKAKLLDGTIVPLQKFASMGSALCFPYEQMVFATICTMVMLQGTPYPTQLQAQSALGKCSLFGDDILIPKEYASLLALELSSFGMKVNGDKSFWTGKFRESCGSDWYDGVLVTPTYVRHCPSEGTPSSIVSLASAANKFYQRGYHDTAWYIHSKIGKFLPYRALNEDYVGFTFAGKEKVRYNRDLQRHEIVNHVSVAKTSTVKVDGYYGLSDWFVRSLRASDTTLMKERRKETSLKIKKVWIPIHQYRKVR